MDKKIYILLPVYNVEKFLGYCLDSILKQTYKNWEAILVDDGSTDNSGTICDRYAARDSRFKVVHQENKGLFGARITGVGNITEVENTYCIFLDSDDAIPANALELYSNVAESNDCDIVCGNAQKFLNYKKPNLFVNGTQATNLKFFEDDDIINKLFVGNFGYGSFSVSFWGKLFKTEIIKEAFAQIKTWPHFFGEDLNANLRILPLAKKVATFENIVYFYRYGGGTNKFMKTYIDDCILLYHTKKEYAKKYNVNPYFLTLIDVEMKNLAIQYLVMCIRSKTYPHGRLEDEIEYLLNIPEFYNATASITDEVLKKDYSEAIGFTQSFIKKDVSAIKKIVTKRANERRLVRFIKNML